MLPELAGKDACATGRGLPLVVAVSFSPVLSMPRTLFLLRRLQLDMQIAQLLRFDTAR